MSGPWEEFQKPTGVKGVSGPKEDGPWVEFTPAQERHAGHQLADIMNIPGGVTRNLVARATGNDPKATLLKAIEGKQPTSSEMYGHGAVHGFVEDALQDPTMGLLGLGIRGGRALTNKAVMAALRKKYPSAKQGGAYVPGKPGTPRLQAGLSALARATEKAPGLASELFPISRGLKAAGRGVYRESLKDLDQAAPGVVDDLWDANYMTTGNQALPKLEKVINRLDDTNQEIASQVSQRYSVPTVVIEARPNGTFRDTMKKRAFPAVDTKRAMKEARAKQAELSAAQGALPAVNAAEVWIVGEEAAKRKGFNEALTAQSVYRDLGRSAEGGEGSPAAQLYQAAKRGYGLAIGDAIEAAGKYQPDLRGYAQTFRGNNQKMGRMINAKPAARALKKNLLSGTDATIMAGGLGLGASALGAKLLLLKRGLQALPGPAVGTYGGKALYGLGNLKAPVVGVPLPLDPFIYQGAVHATSPWRLIPVEENEK